MASTLSATASDLRMQPVPVPTSGNSQFHMKSAKSARQSSHSAISVADLTGEYDISCSWLLTGSSNTATVNLELVDEATGEISITGWPLDYAIKAFVDAEASTITVPNNQILGADMYGDVNYFYIKRIVDNIIPEGSSEKTATVGIIDGDNIVFPAEEAWSIGMPDNEGAGFIFLAYNMQLAKYVEPEAPNEGWTKLGDAMFQEGYMMPVFIKDQTIRANWYAVELQQNESNPNIYRLVDPYHGNYPLADANECSRTGYIQFDVTDPDHVVFDIVPAGFAFSPLGIGQLYCYNQLTWRMMDENASASDIIEKYGDTIPYTTFKDGIVTLGRNDEYIDACFGAPGNISGGMIWVDQNGAPANMETKIFFPGHIPGMEDLYNGWHDVGTATFQDGWYIPVLSIDQTQEESHYEVMLQQNDENPCLLRIVDPFHGDNPMAMYNKSNDFGYIEFDITDPDHVVFTPVSAGMAMNALDISEFYCYNSLTHAMLTQDKTAEEIISDPANADMLFSTFKDNVLTVPSVQLDNGYYNNDARIGYQGAIFAGEQWEFAEGLYTNMEAKIFFPEGFIPTATDMILDSDPSLDSNAPVEYYNIQGIRINAPISGQLTIRRQGSKVTKFQAK